MNKHKLPVLTGILLLVLTFTSRAENLFVDVPSPLNAKIPAMAKRQRYVTMNPAAIAKLGVVGSKFDVTLFDGEQLTFHVDKADLNPVKANSITLRCSNPDQPLNNMVLARVNDCFSASVHTADGRVFQIGTAKGSTHYIRELDPNIQVSCGIKGKTQPAPAFQTQSAPANVSSAENIATTVITPNIVQRPILDVLVVYTPMARDGAGSDDAINAQIAQAMAEGQLALDNSQVNVQLRLVGTALVNYTESGVFDTDLARLANPTDGFADDAYKLRDKYKADIVSLWVELTGGTLSRPNPAGLAYQLIPNAGNYTYNVIYRPLATGLYIPVHEIGHNFGCDHALNDPYSATLIYPYAHAFKFQSLTRSNETVMTAVANPNTRIPYFSNPNISYDGFATGTADANNALVMNNTAAKLTSFRTPPGVGEGLDLLTVTWTTGGDAGWFWEPGISHDTVDAAQSGGLTNGQTSWLQGTIAGPARLTFWCKTEGQAALDTLTFSNNANSSVLSGTNDWSPYEAFIPAGPHVIRWTYDKLTHSGIDQGHGWVDQVKVQPLHVPTVAISTPAAGTRVFAAPLTVQGTAKDDIQVSEVDYMLQNGSGNSGWLVANGATNWNANLTLVPGTNTITVRSVGYGGQTSALLSRSFFYVVTNQLTVTTNGLGKITPDMNGKFLEIGRRYKITAIASNNWVFSNWSGSLSSNSAVLNFLMQPNMVLNGNFVTNPFIPVAGVYNGLFSEPGNVRQTSAGFITFTLATSGIYVGKMILDGGIYKLSGRFDLNGFSQITVARLRTNTVTVALDINLATPDDTVAGSVSNANWFANFSGDRAVFNAVKNKAVGFAGKYTLAINGNVDPTTAPAGDSIAVVTVDNGGIIHASGTLADGTPFSQAVSISKNGAWPLFAPLYSSKGMLFCPVTFNGSPASTLSGAATWIKPPIKSIYYSNGFTLNTPLIGSAFNTPSNGVRILNMTNATATLTGANLLDGITNSVTLNSNNTFTVAGTNGTVLIVNKLSGAMTGSRFTHPVTRKASSISAVILQNQNEARGNFRGTNQSGQFLLQPN